ncbi:MAG: methyl-accepting chemotaxis protein [Pseudomonadota bacterium]
MGKAALLGQPVSGDALWDEEAWLTSGWIRAERDGETSPPLPSDPSDEHGEQHGVEQGSREALTLEDLQRKGALFLTRSNWLLTLIVTFMAGFGSSQVWWAALTVFACTLLQTYGLLRGSSAGVTSVLVAVGAAPIPTCIIFAFRGAGLDPDLLVPFLVAPIILIGLCDKRLVWFVTAAFMAQYLGLRLYEKITLGFRVENIWGICVESLGILLVACISASVAESIARLLRDLLAARRENARSAALLKDRSHELTKARHRVDVERQERERLETEQTKARKAEMRRLAHDFEASISVVTQAIGNSAQTLDRNTKALNLIAQDTEESAVSVSDSANAASNAAKTVAQGMAQLSGSIAMIAGNVSQQDELTSKATRRSTTGGDAVGDLAQHSDTIGEATRAIVRIAERTDLLSLNAAIEAASAGAAGRGFTIVAQEVKALAMQASEAAIQIDDFLKGVKSGTHEAERSFKAIDSAITELAEAAIAIRWDVEKQRKSADTIESVARNASDNVGEMAERSRKLVSTATSTQKLSAQLDAATAAMLRNVRDLEQSTAQFVATLKAD